MKGPLTKIISNYSEDERKRVESTLKGLVNELLKIRVENADGGSQQLEGEYVEPIQLQVVCRRWWDESDKSRRPPTKQPNLKDLTNVDKALEDFYVEAVHEASKADVVHGAAKADVDERVIREWCEHDLITSSGTRSIIHRGRDYTGGLPNEVVDILEHKYLIRRDWRSGASWYELAHDRLISPIKNSNKEWHDKQVKLKRSFRLKVILPIAVIAIVGISIFAYNIYEQPVLQENKLVDALVDTTTSLIRSENYTGAIKNLDKALAINPNDASALNNKGLALKGLKDYTGAIECYNKALAIDPHNVDALTNEGVALYDLGNYHDAIVSYDKALALNPNDVDTINNKANALGKLGKSLEAIQLYQRAIKLVQSNQASRAAFTSGKSLYVFISENEQNQTSYSAYNGQNQTSYSAYNGQNQKIITIQLNLAGAYADAKQYNLAIDTYTQIINENPYNACALLGRADAYKKLGEIDLATKNENLANMLGGCHTSGTNLQKPSQPDLVTTFAASLFH